MKKILPFVVSEVTCYPATSEACGILFAEPAIHDWMFNNFIQIFEVDESHVIDYYDFAIDKNPFLSYNEIEYTFLMKNWDGILDFIKSAIDDDYYVRLFANTSKIEAYDFLYNQQHDLIIYGYDFEEKNLFVADHFKGGKFSKEVCAFQEFLEAFDSYKLELFSSLPAFMRSVQMIKKETDFLRLRYSMYTPKQMDTMLTFNIKRIVESLQDYIECHPTRGWFTRGTVMGEYYSKTHRWGWECYSTLCDLVDELFDEGKYNLLARQSFFLMYNHKTVMVKRLELLKRKGLLKNAESNIAKIGRASCRERV